MSGPINCTIVGGAWNQTGQPGGILLHRSVLMVESILAVWQAGGAYIPWIERAGRRITGILNDGGAPALITAPGQVNRKLKPFTKGKSFNGHRTGTTQK